MLETNYYLKYPQKDQKQFEYIVRNFAIDIRNGGANFDLECSMENIISA